MNATDVQVEVDVAVCGRGGAIGTIWSQMGQTTNKLS